MYLFFVTAINVLFILSSINTYASPLTIVPKAGTELPTSLVAGSTVTAYYTIYNNTRSIRNNNYIKSLPPNVSQVTTGGTYPDTCGKTFNLNPLNGSCTLQLLISGPVDGNNSNPQNTLTVCFSNGNGCSGTDFPLDVRLVGNPNVFTNSKFNCLILCESNFSMIASKLGNYSILIEPIDGHYQGNLGFIVEHIKLIFKLL